MSRRRTTAAAATAEPGRACSGRSRRTPSGGMHMIAFALAGVLFLIGGWGAYAGWNRR